MRPEAIIVTDSGYRVTALNAAAEAFTGLGRNEERVRAFAAGFDQHLTKPESVEQLQQLLAAQPQH
jgi:CheY-like chemotaxis protein